jgi:hypothetical protein
MAGAPTRESIPHPPADLATRQLPIVTLAGLGIELYRCHRLDPKRPPAAFNHALIPDRFNAPDGEYGVLYLAADPFAAFIETFGSSMVDAALGLRTVSERVLAQRCLCRFTLTVEPATIQLVNLADGHGLSRLGTDSRIATTKRRDITRRWALAFWQHPDQPDGLAYRACNDPARLAVVLFDRVGDVLRSGCEENLLRDPHRLAAILDHYATGLDPD